MKEEATLRKVLKDNHSKITRTRLAVFHLLLREKPQSIAELVRQLKGEVDRVSVYRTIDLFEKLGIARRVNIGWKYKIELSEIFFEHHHHITCLRCNKVIAVREDHRVEHIIAQLAAGTGFVVTSHQLELQGYCPLCQQRLTSSPAAKSVY